MIYVSHRLDELYEVCDRVTVLRDGRVAHTGELSELSRLELISQMLGRDLDEVEKEGATGFGEEHEAKNEPILQALDINQRHRLHDISFDVRPGEVVGLAGLLGAGRSETAKAIFGADPVDQFLGQVWVSPFYEDDMDLLAELLGTDRLLFGSDFPHAEGLREPLDFVKDIPKFSDGQVHKVMRDNVRELLGLG